MSRPGNGPFVRRGSCQSLEGKTALLWRVRGACCCCDNQSTEPRYAGKWPPHRAKIWPVGFGFEAWGPGAARTRAVEQRRRCGRGRLHHVDSLAGCCSAAGWVAGGDSSPRELQRHPTQQLTVRQLSGGGPRETTATGMAACVARGEQRQRSRSRGTEGSGQNSVGTGSTRQSREAGQRGQQLLIKLAGGHRSPTARRLLELSAAPWPACRWAASQPASALQQRPRPPAPDPCGRRHRAPQPRTFPRSILEFQISGLGNLASLTHRSNIRAAIAEAPLCPARPPPSRRTHSSRRPPGAASSHQFAPNPAHPTTSPAPASPRRCHRWARAAGNSPREVIRPSLTCRSAEPALHTI
jgi:hypothetical protein